MIPNLGALRSSFVTLLENSGAFSPAERREAIHRMFSAKGYEWSFLCPADPAKRALLIPAPWSITPLVLSGRFAELVVWDPEPRRAELLRRFYKNLRLPVRVIDGPLDRMAHHTERYSLVALEDSFAQLTDRVPADVLSWAACLLEPDGQCCVVTANRLGLSTFRGGVLSPVRGLGQLFRHSHPLPSLDGLRRRLRRASLVAQSTYSLYPNHRQPREILGWSGTLPRHVRSQFFRLLDRLGLIARIHDGFMVIAGQERLAPGFVEQLLMRLRDALSLEAVPAVVECRVQRTGLLLFFISLHDQGDGVLRLPLHHRGALRMDAARRVLARLAERAPQIYSLAPEQLAFGALAGTPYTLERKLSGVPAAELITTSRTDTYILEEAFQFLDRLSRVHFLSRQIDDEFAADYFEPVIATLRRHHPKLLHELNALQAFLVRSTQGQKLPLIWVHGDFNVKNVLFHPAGKRLSGVVDWDQGKELGLPLQDLLHFILSIHRRRRGWCIGQVVVRALEGGLFDATERSALNRYRDILGLHEVLFAPLLVVQWAQHVAGQFEDAAALPTDKWLEENFRTPLRHIRCLIK